MKMKSIIIKFEDLVVDSDIVSIWYDVPFFKGMIKNGERIVNVAEFNLEDLMETLIKRGG